MLLASVTYSYWVSRYLLKDISLSSKTVFNDLVEQDTTCLCPIVRSRGLEANRFRLSKDLDQPTGRSSIGILSRCELRKCYAAERRVLTCRLAILLNRLCITKADTTTVV
jgi:hypothetical protein